MNIMIKTCGLKSADIVAHAVRNGADQVGFIFFEKSPRHILPQTAEIAAQPARRQADIVAVTVDADDTYLDEIVTVVKPDILQLHGKETPQRVGEVKQLFGLPVMKALAIGEAADLDRTLAYIDIADHLLFDAKAPKNSELPGGNGIFFDWHLLDKLDQRVQYMLSGGLNADNVCAALKNTRAIGLDVSSGLESAPGIKDKDLMDNFFKVVRKC